MEAGHDDGIVRVCCMGAGHLAGVSMAVLAAKCRNLRITVCDPDQQVIQVWSSGGVPFYERQLESLLKLRGVSGSRLRFSEDINGSLNQASVIIVAVDISVERENGAFRHDLSKWKQCLEYVARPANANKLVIEKSNLPPNAGSMIETFCLNGRVCLNIVFGPECFAHGTAVRDAWTPKKVVYGGPGIGTHGFHAFRAIYPADWIPEDRFILLNSIESTLLAKVGTNLMLASKIVTLNTLATLCEDKNANIDEVLKVLSRDERIGGENYLHPSNGFGGPGLPKDLHFMSSDVQRSGRKKAARLFKSLILSNKDTQYTFVDMVASKMIDIHRATFCILGFSFKYGTSSVKHSPVVEICKQLLKFGVRLRIHDPHVQAQDIRRCFRPRFNNALTVVGTPLQAAENASAICLLTDWDYGDVDQVQFYTDLYDQMAHPSYIFNGAYIDLPLPDLANVGFSVHKWGAHNRVG